MKLSNLLVAALALVVVLSSCSRVPRTGKMDFKNQTDSVSYALGFVMANNMKKEWERLPFEMDSLAYIDMAKAISKRKLDENFKNYQVKQFEDLNEEAFFKGFLNQMAYGKSYFTDMNADIILRKAYQEVKTKRDEERKEEAAKNLEEGKKFLEENKKRSEVVETESGLQYEIIREGNGPVAEKMDKVRCTYHGTLLDGTVFDSSIEKGDTTQFRVMGVIKGWTEALQLMPEGSKWRLYVPSELAYGDKGSGQKIGPNETLIFDIDLVEVEKEKK
ncbi:FKBP-type peptidyl-prolyl cis-trans isomerase [Carboxylicivirga linearis]|uniref:Peptidyl-prolyl cis-trans isomerase n=1 Tax=Carboxylicivirga linearis TaxID=1628157 RepID=A0ABS5JSR4_9BACT|nr:FKBP-type peptidyl-prolyl cis-trans isomerase [Carboxylicivirga linearis]MBS2097956.1 FKBP-type peptidyl-prolyl cis-trans isomerase [Carboxylicivirga linearis]